MFDGLKRRATFRSLDTYRQNAFHIPDYQLQRDRFVIFSDAHKGDKRQTLDEFKHNEALYCHALDYYLNGDYGLVLNGDMEEGWKNDYNDIMTSYEHTVYAREREFARLGARRHLRIWGNHDDDWMDQHLVNRYLGGVLGQPVKVHPAVVLGDRIMIAHGHQGTPDGEYMARFSRMAIRYFWRHIQGLMNLERRVNLTINVAMQERENHLSEWALSRRMLMIAGHTHRPVFHAFSPINALETLRDSLVRQMELAHDQHWRNVLTTMLDMLDRLLETAETFNRNLMTNLTPDAAPMVPCYVNSGSLLSAEGITGIEIDRGEIRLVQWSPGLHGFERQIHQQGDLGRMLASF